MGRAEKILQDTLNKTAGKRPKKTSKKNKSGVASDQDSLQENIAPVREGNTTPVGERTRSKKDKKSDKRREKRLENGSYAQLPTSSPSKRLKSNSQSSQRVSKPQCNILKLVLLFMYSF